MPERYDLNFLITAWQKGPLADDEDLAMASQIGRMIAAQVAKAEIFNEDREDITSQVWIKVLGRIKKWSPKRGEVGTFLFSVVRSAVWDCKRRLMRRAELDMMFFERADWADEARAMAGRGNGEEW